MIACRKSLQGWTGRFVHHACRQSCRTALTGIRDLQGLPAWNLLLLTRRPFAVPLANLADVPAVLAGMKAKVWCEPCRTCQVRHILYVCVRALQSVLQSMPALVSCCLRVMHSSSPSPKELCPCMIVMPGTLQQLPVLACRQRRSSSACRGPGLLIVDRVVDSVSEEHYYLTPGEGGSGVGLQVTEGAQVAGGPAATCGQVSRRTPCCTAKLLMLSQL